MSRGDERGQTTVLIVGLAVVLLMAIAVVVDASAAYLQRQGLDTVADGAALAGADAGSRNLDVLYGEGVGRRPRLDQAETVARAAVADYLGRPVPTASTPGCATTSAFDPADDSVDRPGPRPARPAADLPRLAGAAGRRRRRLGGRADRGSRLSATMRGCGREPAVLVPPFLDRPVPSRAGACAAGRPRALSGVVAAGARGGEGLGEDDAMVVCRSALPYSLNLVLHAERREPTHLETTLAGDLEGVVRWYLADLGPETRMDFEQEVHVTGRLLRLASGVGPSADGVEPRPDDEGMPGRAARPAEWPRVGATERPATILELGSRCRCRCPARPLRRKPAPRSRSSRGRRSPFRPAPGVDLSSAAPASQIEVPSGFGCVAAVGHHGGPREIVTGTAASSPRI